MRQTVQEQKKGYNWAQEKWNTRSGEPVSHKLTELTRFWNFMFKAQPWDIFAISLLLFFSIKNCFLSDHQSGDRSSQLEGK